MQHRRPAARHPQEAAVARVNRPAAGDGSEGRVGDSLAAGHIDDRRAGEKLDAVLLRLGLQRRCGRPWGRGPQIREGHGDARHRQVEGRAIGGVVVGGDHGAAGGRHGEAMEVGSHRRGQHDAGPVVVGEDERPLGSTRRQHDGAGAERDDDLARFALGGIGPEMAPPLHQRHRIAVIEAERGGAKPDRDIVECAQLPQACGAPGLEGSGERLRQQAAAGQRILLDQHHAGAAAPGGQSGRQARRAAAHDQHIGEFVARLIAVGIALVGARPQAGRPADEGLVEHPGASAGTHEGLVVEPRGQQRGSQGIDRHQIELDRGPGVLAPRDHAMHEVGHGGGNVRLPPVAFAQGEEGVGLLHPGGEQAPRAMQLEAAPDQGDARRHQGRGQSVAGEALEAPAIEGEGDGPLAVDAPALGQAPGEGAGHCPEALSRAGREAPTSLVAVLRSSTSHWRQPSTCCQYSRCGPLGLSNRKTWSCQVFRSPVPWAGRVLPASPP